MDEIRYYQTGIQFKDNRTSVAGYLHGTQSIDFNIDVPMSEFFDVGRLGKRSFEKSLAYNITLERFVSNYSNNPSLIFGPLAHHIFAVSDTKYSRYSGPSSYKESYFLNNFGSTNTNNLSTDIKDFDIRIATKELQYTGPEVPEYDLLFKKSMLTNLEYSIEAGSYLKERSVFKSSIRKDSTDSDFGKSIINLNEITPQNERINLVNAYRFNKQYTTIPTFLANLCNDSWFVDNSVVLGIKSINMSLGITYGIPVDFGRVLGATNEEEVNLFKRIYPPLESTISFSVIAQKEIPELLLQDETFGMSRIVIVFQCPNFNPASNTPNFLVFHFGKRNRLASISKSGGSTGSGPVEYTFEYKNINNDFCCYFTNGTNFSLADENLEKY